MSYEKDKRIFKRTEETNKEELVSTKLEKYLNRTNYTEEDIKEICDYVDVIIDNNIDDLDKIGEFIDKADNKALYNVSYIKEFTKDLASSYSKELEELEDEYIEEITERNKKGIINWFKDSFSKKDKKTPKVVTLFKNFFKKKDDVELEDEEIEEVKERRKNKFSFKSLFSKKNKNVKNNEKIENEIDEVKEKEFEELSLNEKLFKYLDGVNYTWKDLSNIVNKISEISNDEEKLEKLNMFFNENKDLAEDEKISKLVYKIIEVSANSKNNSCTLNLNPNSEVIKKFFNENELDTIPKLVSLYNEIVMNDENIDKLYDYIVNNIEESKNADSIISKMNEILGKTLTNNEAKPVMVKKDSKNESKIVSENLYKDSKEENKSGKKAKILYDRYNQLQHSLNDKYDELEYLKNEYRVIERLIYGNKPNELSIEKKRNILLVADKEKLQILKEKLSEIKSVEKDIDLLISKISSYYEKYGMDYGEKYKQDYVNSINDILFNKEIEDIRKEKMNASLDLYNQFNDEEINTIYKYMNYTKGI